LKIISFSGIDGAGKSTQIAALEGWLRGNDLTTRLLIFWEDVAVASRFREFMSHAAFKGDRGIGTPQTPLQRRDKNVTSLPVLAARFFLYFADAVSLRRTINRVRKSNFDVLIFDRYVYDELANLPLNRWLARRFAWAVLRLAPEPDIAFLIDADPPAARARKPEYPLEFLLKNREAYLTLARITGQVVIEPQEIGPAQIRVRDEFRKLFPIRRVESSSLQFPDQVEECFEE
jgi:thymidylate kinase